MRTLELDEGLRGRCSGHLAKRLSLAGMGRPADGFLELHPIEALLVLERGTAVGRLGGRAITFEEALSRLASSDPRAFDLYLAYRDLRMMGLKPRPGDGHLILGGARMDVLRPEDPLPVRELEEVRETEIRFLAVPDREGDVTYYELRGVGHLEGSFPLPRGGIVVEALGDRYLVSGGRGELEQLMYGVRTEFGLILSQEEYSFLHKLGLARGPNPIRGPFDEIYSTLRMWGTAPKSGLKFGALYRVYAGPSSRHSEWLVSPASSVSDISTLAGLARVAHAVRKVLLLWIGGRSKMVSVRWTKRPTAPP
ncbi:MAG: hypothetical protein DRN14_04155 [Thermoplasmata archaeon]|nr:MAG: hypothetical protein DRN14_04155 [Thermoplasmata archaeon]